MDWEIISREPHEYGGERAMAALKVCDDAMADDVNDCIDAAVDYIQKKRLVSLQPLKVVSYLRGGNHKLPFTPVKKVLSAKVETSHGVLLNGVAYEANLGYVCLDELCPANCAGCNACGSRYHITYLTRPIEASPSLKKAVWSVAMDMFDGVEIRDVSKLLRGVGVGNMGQFINAVGGVNLRII